MDEETNESRASRIASNVEPVDAREEVANAGNHYLVARPAVPCRRMNSRRRRNGGARASGTEPPRTREETSTEDGPRTSTGNGRV